MRIQDIALLVLAIAGTSTRAGEFVNLDFDGPDLSHLRLPDYPQTQIYEAPIGEALRGWSVSWDSDPVFQPPDTIRVWWGNSAPLSLKSLNPTPPNTMPPFQLSILPDGGGSGGLRPGLHLWQVGTVPSEAVELRYYGATWYAGPPFMAQPPSILINDEVIAYQAFGGSPYELAINVRPFAGHEVKLEIYFPQGKWQSHSFDIYGFVPIPESTTCCLVVLGSMVLLLERLFKRKTQA